MFAKNLSRICYYYLGKYNKLYCQSTFFSSLLSCFPTLHTNLWISCHHHQKTCRKRGWIETKDVLIYIKRGKTVIYGFNSIKWFDFVLYSQLRHKTGRVHLFMKEGIFFCSGWWDLCFMALIYIHNINILFLVSVVLLMF